MGFSKGAYETAIALGSLPSRCIKEGVCRPFNPNFWEILPPNKVLPTQTRKEANLLNHSHFYTLSRLPADAATPPWPATNTTTTTTAATTAVTTHHQQCHHNR